MPEEGDTCPIVSEYLISLWSLILRCVAPWCFDDFEDAAAIVFCEASCGGPVHQICIAQWLATKPEPTCVYCRAPWPKAGGASAGDGEVGRDGRYVNLAAAAGLRGHRDTSTYYHG